VALYEFGSFVLDTPERRLTRQGERIAVTGKTLDVLRLLVEAEGRLVDRPTFNAQLWPEVIVEDRNLTVHISALRKALGSDCIETVAKSGYRLAVPVRTLNGRASSEARQVLREARYQLSQAERVPTLKALGLFERVLAVDANDAEALAGLASTYLLLSSTTIRRPLPVDEAMQLATDAARRALAIDSQQGEAYAVLGRLKMTYDWDWNGAEADLERAVLLAPRSVEAQVGNSLYLSAVGRHPSPVVEPFGRSGRDGSRCRLHRMHQSAGRLADPPSVSGCRPAGPVRTRWRRCRLLMPWRQRLDGDPPKERRRTRATISGDGVNAIPSPGFSSRAGNAS
jgi:DNA-binding winged helix-turn-helix (wHTH) protein